MTAPQQVLQQTDAPAWPTQCKLRFEVVAGLHRGAVLLLDGADYRIGSSPAADIVLSDPGVAPEHAVLHVEHGMARIDAVGADVMVEQERLPFSRGCCVMLPANFTLGAAQIQLSDPDCSGPDRQIRQRPLTVVGVLACGALAIVAAMGLPQTVGMLGLTVAAVSADSGASEHATLPVGPSVADFRSPYASAAEDAVRALKARLEAAKIQTLRVSAENGRLTATGTLSTQAAADWVAIQQWFDQTYGGRIVLTTRIDPPGAPRTMPALRLQAIWCGEQPYIVTADGEHYFKGAVLDSGWIIRDISEDRLLLVKDGETVALTYR